MKKRLFVFLLLFVVTTMFLFTCVGCNFNGKGSADSAESGWQNSDGTDEQIDGVGGQIVLRDGRYLLFLSGGERTARLEYNLYDNARLIEGKSAYVCVEDADVVEIKDNMISAKKVGSTKITLKYKNATAVAEVSVTDRVSQDQVNAFDEKFVNLYGRAYKKDGKLCLDNPGSAIEVALFGGSLSADLEVDGAMYVWVEVDGVKTKRIKLTSDTTRYSLVEDLSDEYHVVRVVDSSEAAFGQIRVRALYSDNFYAAPEKPDFLVEYIGDSITAGYGSLGIKGDARTLDNSDACSTYAYLSARELGVDYSTVAVSGIAVTKRVWDSKAKNMEEVYPCYSAINDTPYEFTRPADVVAINLGTNEHNYLQLHPQENYEYEFPDDYLRFLQYVRSKNPNAFIICLYGFAAKSAAISDGITAAVKAMNDEKIVYLDNTFRSDGSGVNGHPPADAQIEWGRILADYIRKLTYIK